MFSKIHHIAIIGTDYNRSKSFYVDKLGFKILRENYRPSKQDYKIDLECGDSEIELFIVKDAPDRASNPEASGLRHMAFKVESVSDTVFKLKKMGIECEPIRMDDYTNKAMTFFRDPDNLPIEIHE